MINELAVYPIIDEDLMSEMEIEDQDRAWESWVESNFRSEIDPDDELDIDDDELYEVFRAACEEGNEYWIDEVGSGAWIDIEAVAKHADITGCKRAAVDSE
jgi:hypothetical protein